MQLDPFPQCIGAAAGVQSRRTKLALDALYGFRAAPVVEVDPVARDMREREPVPRLVIALRGTRAFAKQRVVTIESVAQHVRDRKRRIVGGNCDDRGGACGGRHRWAGGKPPGG